jgi:hypothetical protein
MMRGARFREEQRARLTMLDAWTTAALVRYPRKRRFPTLDSLLRPSSQRAEGPAMREHLMDWARRGQRQGLAIRLGRLDQPFSAAEGPANA